VVVGMMTPEMMAREIAQAFSTCRKFKRLTPQALAEQAGCDLAVVKRIESAAFEACFALREKYSNAASLERRLCDAIGLTPAMCIALDDGIIF